MHGKAKEWPCLPKMFITDLNEKFVDCLEKALAG